jgi:hypothetical protein
MITIPFSKNTLNLEPSEWEGVQELVKQPASIMIYSHEDQAKTLLALGICLSSTGLGFMRMHVYHTCQEDPILLQDFETGFVEGECPICNNYLEDDDVEYDIELVVKFNIKLED